MVVVNPAADPTRAQDMLDRVNDLTGHSYRLGKRIDGGVAGGWVVSEGDHVACLKWFPGNANLAPQRAAAMTCERLRAAGSPVPRYHRVDAVDGDGFVLMDFMAGHPVGTQGGLTVGQAGHLVDLIELQAGAAVLPAGPPDTTVDGILQGDFEHIRAHSAESAELLGRVQAIARELSGVRLPSGDIVHGDMNQSNFIVDRKGGDRITGIVDWENTFTGDRAADVATILFYLRGGDTGEVLWDRLVAMTTEDTLRLRVVALACWALTRDRELDRTRSTYSDSRASKSLERASAFLNRISD